ncbi:MAG TPA: NAD(P)-dependent oxidoreductase [Actinomycetota bacterium]
MAVLAFCGLGHMGAPMARRLLQAGHEVAVWNRTEEKARPLVEAGARAAASPADAAEGAEAAFTMLADPGAVREVVLGTGGLAESLRGDATLIEMSTIGIRAVREIAEALPEGVAVLDTPVLGSVAQAEEGTLRIFVGGPSDLVDRWAPTLRAMGTPQRFGDLGAGAAMKLVVNSTLGALMAGLGEALALADALGVDEEAALDVLEGSPIGATTRSKRDKIASGRYPPNFRLGLAAKDLRLVVEEAVEAGARLPVAEAVLARLEAARDAGLGGLDYSAVIPHVRGRPATG